MGYGHVAIDKRRFLDLTLGILNISRPLRLLLIANSLHERGCHFSLQLTKPLISTCEFPRHSPN
jgi:hypothetical protein